MADAITERLAAIDREAQDAFNIARPVGKAPMVPHASAIASDFVYLRHLATVLRERAALQAERDALRERLLKSNELLRSCFLVATRGGAETNWTALRDRLGDELVEQHAITNAIREALQAVGGPRSEAEG